MRAHFYHYFFVDQSSVSKERICHNLLPMLKAYVEFNDPEWKTGLIGDDGESTVLLPGGTRAGFIIISTREQDILKALNKHKCTYKSINEILGEDEAAGFAAYVAVQKDHIAICSSTRGPRYRAFGVFINRLLGSLIPEKMRFDMQEIGTSITLSQARAKSFVARTRIKVAPHNNLFAGMVRLLGIEGSNVDSFDIVVQNKRKCSIKDVFEAMAREARGGDVDRFIIRARDHVDEALTDFYLDHQGSLTHDVPNGADDDIMKDLHRGLMENQDYILSEIERIKNGTQYGDESKGKALSPLSGVDYWGHVILGSCGVVH